MKTKSTIITRLKQAADQLRMDRLIVFDDDHFDQLSDEQKKDWKGYAYKMTYGVVTPESAEVGDYDDRGWVEEGSEPYKSLESILYESDIRDKSWLEWSGYPPSPSDWIISDEEQDYSDGSSTTYDLWIYRVDGLALSKEEMLYIHKALRLYGKIASTTKKSSIIASIKKFLKIAQDMEVIYTDEDRGNYAEGRDEIRKVLVELLVNAFEGTELQPYAEEIVNNLKESPGNTWFDEKAAIKMLNPITEEGLTWHIEDDILMLLVEDDFEQDGDNVE